MTTLVNAAAKAALKLLKKPSVMVDDTAKFAGKFGEKEAVKHLGKTRVDKARKAIEKKMKSEGYFNDICKDDKIIKKPLKKRDFEIKNNFTKYWNEPKDNLEIVLYNDDFSKKYMTYLINTIIC